MTVPHVKIGLLGCGVVGGGVVSALQQNRTHLLERCSLSFEVIKTAVRNLTRPREPGVQQEWLCTDWREVCDHPEIEVVVEAMGGLHPAYEAVRGALEHGKHVVTANKELLATFGEELYQIAEAHRCVLLCEASALGGVPVLHAFEQYYAANRVQKIAAIANGTSNYILTRMREDNVHFAEALAEAQEKGYAESDPSMDILGLDARFKLQILSRSAFGTDVRTNDIECVGITDIDVSDMEVAARLGTRIRLVATAELDGGTVRASIRPTLLPAAHPLYSIDGVNNALCVTADIVGEIVYSGPGAGAFATASAVVEDLVRLASQPYVIKQRRDVKPATAVYPVQYPGYLVVHRCSGIRKLGPYALPSGIPAIQSADYVYIDELQTECWVIQGDRSFVEDWAVHALRAGLGEVRWYPFLAIPAAYPADLTVHPLNDAGERAIAE